LLNSSAKYILDENFNNKKNIQFGMEKVGVLICYLAYIHYHGISSYQFYIALKYVKKEATPEKIQN
jgi:hypothetical protein